MDINHVEQKIKLNMLNKEFQMKNLSSMMKLEEKNIINYVVKGNTLE